jgi:hypothetical protein
VSILKINQLESVEKIDVVCSETHKNVADCLNLMQMVHIITAGRT